MGRRIWIAWFVTALSLVFAGMVCADSPDIANLNAVYPSPTNSCSTCHTTPPSLNSYGSAYLANGRSPAALTAIGPPASAADTTGPTLTITSHTNGQTVTAASITLSGTATDSGRGNSGIQQVMVNGVAASGGTAATTATANWSRTLTLAAGANIITVVAYDNSSGHNTTTQNLTINYTAPVSDVMSPTLTITSHTNGQTVTAASITLSGTATDSGRGNSGIQQVMVNGVAASGGTATGSATSNWSRALTLAAGANSITVVAYDNSTSHNATTQGLTINYTAPVSDATGPTMAVTSHTNGQTVTTASITLSGTATDSGRGNSGIQQVTVNGVAASGGTATGSATSNWSRALTLAAGANSITVVAYDNSTAHNTTTQNLTINYSAAAADATGPTMAVTSHTNGQTVTTASITLSGTATDSGRGNSGIQQVTVNGVAASGGTATGSATSNWSRALTLAAGANSITVVAYDNSTAHNTTTQNLTINYSAAAADTTGPTLAITSHTNGQTVTTASITLSGTATDSGRGNSGIQQVTVNGVAASGGTATGSATSKWSRALTLAAGANSITVVAYDNSASHNTVTRNLTINFNGNTTSQPPPPDNLPSFSHPTQITNPYFPLARMRRHILEGTVGGQQVRVVRTLKNRTESFQVGDQTVRTLVMEDRSYVDGELEEVALDYFAQADDGTVYYLGEDVNIYSNGKVVSHEGAWRYGVDTNQLGVIMPARPKVGTTFQAEKVPGITTEDNEVLSVLETVRVPAGRFRNCLKVQETLSDSTVEFKYYAPHVGVVKEVTEGGSIDLISVGHSEEGDDERD